MSLIGIWAPLPFQMKIRNFSKRHFRVPSGEKGLNTIYEVYSSLGLAVYASKTELMYQWRGVEPAVVPVVTVGRNELKVSSQFNYHGSILIYSCSSDAEVDRRINQAQVSFGRIRQRMIPTTSLPQKRYLCAELYV